MKLKELLSGFDVGIEAGDNPDVFEIRSDSRKISDGELFIALKGENADGHMFADEAYRNGASAILAEDAATISSKIKIPVIEIKNLKTEIYKIACPFYYNPSSKMSVIGVTGTNGKTSTTYFIKKILESMGLKVGLIGTIKHMIGEKSITAANTTPDALELQKLLYRMWDDGVKVVVMEVSSHALTLKRVAGIEFDVSVFTNLTEDHLDFHKNMANYVAAKLSFIDYLKKSSKSRKWICYNSSIEYLEQLKNKVESSAIPYWTYGIDSTSDFRAVSPLATLQDTKFYLESLNGNGQINLQARGFFTIYNCLAAFASTAALGAGMENFKTAASVSIPGRFEIIKNNKGFLVVVDYAHTPDALLNLIEAAEKLKPERIITVFGCGGDRDKKKRPIMGKIAITNSDYVVVTSDNPRSENPSGIIDAILKGIQNSEKPFVALEDRRNAIEFAVKEAKTGDIVLIVGKGHETYQIFKNRTIHFDDREEALKALETIS